MAKETVFAYIDAINEHDVEKLAELMAEDHVFIDTYDGEVQGCDDMKEGWKGYFAWFPDYLIEPVDIFTNGNVVAIFGYASASYKGLKSSQDDSYWKLPAAWKAIVSNGQIASWKVICDSKIPMETMNERDREDVPEYQRKR